MSMSISDAEKLLGLSGVYSADDVDKAFKAFVKKYHPDVSERHGMDSETANWMILKAGEARDVLKKEAAFRSYCVSRDERTEEAHSQPEPAYEPQPQPEPAQTHDVEDDENDGSAEKAESEPEADEPAKTDDKKEKHCPPLVELVVDGVYYGRLEDSGVLAFLLLVVGWVLPFYLFGGLNIIPSWKGLFVPDAMQFVIFYLGFPMVSLANLIFPIHFLNLVVKGFLMIVLFPLKKAFDL